MNFLPLLVFSGTHIVESILVIVEMHLSEDHFDLFVYCIRQVIFGVFFFPLKVLRL